MTAIQGSSASTDVPLPADKLSPSLPSDVDQKPVVLVNCGSFNPPTIMHLRMFDVAAQVLRKAGHAVLGGYASPVNDAYHKPGLLPSQHRIAMCQLAAAESDLVMVDTWEAAQAQAQRSLIVLQHVQRAVQKHYDDVSCSQQQMPTAGSTSEHPQNSASQQVSRQVKSVLVCGADVLESFVMPGVWVEEQVRQILNDHGVVCITRNSAKLHQLLQEQGNLLHEHRHNVHVAEDPATAGISSTIIRQEIGQGNTVKFLTTNGVIGYIHKHALYTQ